MSLHCSSSIVLPTGTPSLTCSILSLPSFTSQPIVFDNGSRASSRRPELSYRSEHGNEDISDLDDSELEDDLSPILNALAVSSIKITLVSITNLTFFSHQTIPIPQHPNEAEELKRQAFSKRKSALLKSKLADAAFREAKLKAKLCRSQARHAKHVLAAANVYVKNVQWTIQQSKHKSALSKGIYRVTTVMDTGVDGIQCT